MFKVGEYAVINKEFLKYFDCKEQEYIDGYSCNDIDGLYDPGLVPEMEQYIGKKARITKVVGVRDSRHYYLESTGLWWGEWQLDKSSGFFNLE